MDDKDIFASAIADEPDQDVQIEETHIEQPEPEAPVVARDEHGRFAPKPEAEEKPPEPERGPPAWRLKEEADARRAAEQERDRYRVELETFRRQQEQKPKPDMFENPDAFVEQGVRSQVDPVKSELAQLREEFSLERAILKHGNEKVEAAYRALEGGMATNPAVNAVYRQAMASRDPYKVILDWHQKETVYSTIGNDPIAYAKKQAMELAKSDPAFAAEMLSHIRGATQTRPSATTTQLPPSLSRVSSGLPRATDEDDDSDAGLFRQATR